MRLIERRIGLLFAIFLACLLIAGMRASWLGIVRSDSLKSAAATQQTQDLLVPARRGTITDSNGIELAVSKPAYTIVLTPYLVNKADLAARRLAPVLKIDEQRLLEQFTRRDTGFVYLARAVPVARAERAKKVAAKLNLDGLEFVPEYMREYPRRFMASQVLGLVGDDARGRDGLEFRWDKQLRGADGRRRLVRDANGDTIEMSENSRTRAGARVTLTLDSNIQDRTEEVLMKLGKEWRPRAATALVMDPRDGSILAVANWPRVNASELAAAPDYARMNRAVGAVYEPGSTFKAFTAAAALEEGEVTPDTEFDLPPVLKVSDREIADAHERGWQTRSVSGILAESSNVGAALIGAKVGAKRLDRWVRRFGFGTPTGVDMPGEEAGIVHEYEDYTGPTAANVSMGQGLSVTPIQMAAGYAAIANGGILRRPHIVKAVGGKKLKAPQGKRVITEKTSAQIRKMLEGVLGPGGTATGAAIEGYNLAGKTGTAEKADNGEYSKTKFFSSFIGFAPADKPELLVTVMVDEPKGDIYGGTVAGPAFREIMNFALTSRRVAP